MAATTVHPWRYRYDADANPSPRDAPVMTTLRGSVIGYASPNRATRRELLLYDMRPLTLMN
jgi:hypothetical protein